MGNWKVYSPLAMVSTSRFSKLKMFGPYFPSVVKPLTIEHDDRTSAQIASKMVWVLDFI